VRVARVGAVLIAEILIDRAVEVVVEAIADLWERDERGGRHFGANGRAAAAESGANQRDHGGATKDDRGSRR
jgi:hypothetical protein